MVVAGFKMKRPVFNRKRFRYYHIAPKLKETVEARRGVLNPSSSYNPLQLLPPPGPQQILNTVAEDEHKKTPPDSEWVVSIRAVLDKASRDDVGSTWDHICIYKVPYYLREAGDDRSYVPQFASIGPYHHGKNRLPNMNMHKWRSLEQMLKRTEHDVRTYLNALKEIEDRIRACYEGPIDFGSDEFVLMMLLDGCFILELFRGATEDEGFRDLGYPSTDPIFALRGSMHAIQRDLIMLENQLPLFVLDLLLGIQKGQPGQEGLVSELALKFFNPLIPMAKPLTLLEYATTMSNKGSLHCLEVFHRGLLRLQPQLEPRFFMKSRSLNWVRDIRQRPHLIHSVTELREAGIEFKRRENCLFWDVEFKNGILEIPQLLIDDRTKSFFLNLIAFEQCHLNCPSKITSYVIFMHNLIKSPQDVVHLHHRGIIEHWAWL